MRINEIIESKNKDTPLLNLLRKINKPEIIKHFNKYRIYRGIENEDRDCFVQKSGNRFDYKIRKSSILSENRTLAKLGAILLSKLPSWKNYPSREHSYICSTSTFSIDRYGEKYLIFPLSNTNIGMSPNSDFLYSFYVKEIPSSWYSLLRLFVKNKVIDDNGDIHNLEIKGEDDEINKLFYGKNAKKVLDEKLSPDANGFWIVTPFEYHGGDNNEIWFEGEALFISLDYLKNGGQAEIDKYLNEIR